MSLIENYAAERKARLMRLGAIPTNATVAPLTEAQIIKKIGPVYHIPPVEYFYPTFWCWDLVTGCNKVEPTIRNIQAVVAAHYNVSVMHMVSQRRSLDIVFPRQVAYYLVKELTGYSFPKVGKYFGGRDHTTILSGIKKIEARMEIEPDLRETIRTLRARFE